MPTLFKVLRAELWLTNVGVPISRAPFRGGPRNEDYDVSGSIVGSSYFADSAMFAKKCSPHVTLVQSCQL